MGVSLSVTCAAETLVFYFLPQVLRVGVRRCMHAVFAAFLLRMGWYAALARAPSPWLVLPAEVSAAAQRQPTWGAGVGCCHARMPLRSPEACCLLLPCVQSRLGPRLAPNPHRHPLQVMHGFTFALAWGGGSAYCAQLAPPGLEATTQGLFQGGPAAQERAAALWLTAGGVRPKPRCRAWSQCRSLTPPFPAGRPVLWRGRGGRHAGGRQRLLAPGRPRRLPGGVCRAGGRLGAHERRPAGCAAGGRRRWDGTAASRAGAPQVCTVRAERRVGKAMIVRGAHTHCKQIDVAQRAPSQCIQRWSLQCAAGIGPASSRPRIAHTQLHS